MDRDLSGGFGSKNYAREELIAEMGAALMCREFGIDNIDSRSGIEQHAAYLQSWLRTLREDKRAIITAASQAQKAVDFLRESILADQSKIAA